jgi:mycothiol system anti-sigma-R factor
MNCQEASVHLYAFADGEFGAIADSAARHHLEHCPACLGRVATQRALRRAVARASAHYDPPADLRSRVRATLSRETVRRMYEDRSTGFRGYAPAAAVAAIVTLAVLSIWQIQQPAPIAVTDTRPVARKLANDVYELHVHAVAEGPKHHDVRFPREATGAADQLAKELDLPMLQCRNLGVTGGQFESASICGLVASDGRPYEGGHIIFRCPSGGAVSLITVQHLPEAKALHRRALGRQGRLYALLAPTTPDVVGRMTIATWDCPGATHIVCAPLDPSCILRLAEPLRQASLDPGPLHIAGTAGP